MLHILKLVVVGAVSVLLLVSCVELVLEVGVETPVTTPPPAPPMPTPTVPTATVVPSATPTPVVPRLSTILRCPTLEDGIVVLERYLPIAVRATPLPKSGTSEHAAAIPPQCILAPRSGVPPFSGSITVEGQELRQIATPLSELLFELPPLPAGTHTLNYEITDAVGSTGTGSTTLTWAWMNDEQVGVSLTTLNGRYQVGTEFRLNLTAEYSVTAPSIRILDSPAEPTGSITAQVDFGDGNTDTLSADITTGMVAIAHTYTEPGSYEVAVTLTDEFGQTGMATAQITVAANGAVAAGSPYGVWQLATEATDSRQLEWKSGDSNYSAVVGDSAVTLVRRLFVGLVYAGQLSYSFTPPETLLAGMAAPFGITGRLNDDFPNTNLIFRVNTVTAGAPVELSTEAPTASDEPQLLAKGPLFNGQELVVEIDVSDCPQCTRKWVYVGEQ